MEEARPDDELIPSELDNEFEDSSEEEEVDKSAADSTKAMRALIEENEILKIQVNSKEKEILELRKEIDELHGSIGYRVGKWIAETKVGGALKSFLWKYFLNKKKPVE